MTKLSVVIPVYNEQDNVLPLHNEIKEVCENNNYQYEIIFVDDGSSDNTSPIAQTLQPVKLITLRKNFGQTAAMDAGIKAAKYPYIITMDGDRQNDPKDIPALVKHLENNNLDVVSGWRKDRQDNLSKHFVSRGAYLLRKFLLNDNIQDCRCSLKIYKKSCFDNIHLYGEMHRFIPDLLKMKGFEIGEIEVNHRSRIAGVTKYNWKRTFKGFVDMIAVWFWNKFATRPLHLLGGIGFVMIMLGFLSGCISILTFFAGQGMSETAWPMLTLFLTLSGLQLFVTGLLADILLKNYFENTNATPYSIKQVFDTDNNDG